MAQLLQSPWVSGFGTLADAIAQAPLNRQRTRQMELDAANVAADNALAQKKFETETAAAAAKARQDQANWTATHGIAASGENRALELQPDLVRKGGAEADLAITNAVNAPITFKQAQDKAAEDYRHATVLNPLEEGKAKSLADQEALKTGRAARSYNNMDPLAGSLTDEVVKNVQKAQGLPDFNLKDSLYAGSANLPGPGQYSAGEYVPPDPLTGYMDLGRGSTSGMDRVSGDMALEDSIRTQANTAVADENFDSAKWVTDTTKAMGGQVSTPGYRPATPQEKAALNLPDYASVVMDAENKPTVLSNEAPTSYRPATPAEKAQYGVPPETPLVFDQDGKPTVLSDGKSTTNINTGGAPGNAPENKIVDIMDKRYDAAKAAGGAVTAINAAEQALPGAITGAMAEEQLALQKLGALFGVNDTDTIVNTETFRAAIKPVVAAVLRQSVGSTQISDADRRFAEDAAAGNINLDEGSIRRLLNITRAANADIVRNYNSSLDTVYPPGGTNERERAMFEVPESNSYYAQQPGPFQPTPADPAQFKMPPDWDPEDWKYLTDDEKAALQ